MYVSLVGFVQMFFFMKIFFLLNQRRQVLMSLLILESLVLSLVLIVLFLCWDLMIVLIVLSMSACEASIGLSLLVRIIRQFGSDEVSNLVINKW